MDKVLLEVPPWVPPWVLLLMKVLNVFDLIVWAVMVSMRATAMDGRLGGQPGDGRLFPRDGPT